MSRNSELNNGGEDFDRWLADQLRRSETYVDDNGFTDAVMRALPARRLGDLSAAVILTLTLSITSALVLWHLPILGLLIDMGVSLSMLSGPVQITGGLCFIALTSSLGIWALQRDRV